MSDGQYLGILAALLLIASRLENEDVGALLMACAFVMLLVSSIILLFT